MVERVPGLVAGTAAEVPGGDDGDAREGGRQPGDEPLRPRDERDVRHHDDEVVRPPDHPVGGAVEELRRSAPVVVGQPRGVLEVEPPGDVRRRRQFVDRILGCSRGEPPESVRVGPWSVGDEHSDVDLQTDRPLGLGRDQFGRFTLARPGTVHSVDRDPRAP